MPISSEIFHAVDVRLLASTFALVFIAELPDKTALATVFLAAHYRPRAVFVGAAAAFTIQSVVAVCFGSAFGLLPRREVQVGAGALFLALAPMMWLRSPDSPAVLAGGNDAQRGTFAKTAWASFLVIFIAEWGDLTQIATAALAARYSRPLIIFAAATLALWTVAAIAIAIGRSAKGMIGPVVFQRLAALAFAAMGVILLARS
jgi:putative Ca2+/H+ antiporter (TMEM165/GDT1 family)